MLDDVPCRKLTLLLQESKDRQPGRVAQPTEVLGQQGLPRRWVGEGERRVGDWVGHFGRTRYPAWRRRPVNLRLTDTMGDPGRESTDQLAGRIAVEAESAADRLRTAIALSRQL